MRHKPRYYHCSMLVFLSHNSLDSELALGLKRALLDNADHPIEVFCAPNTAVGGGYWQEELAETVSKSDVFLLLVGQHGIGPWQVPEYYEAHDKWVRGRRPILIPVLQEGHRAPGLRFLGQLHWVIDKDPTSQHCVGKIFAAINSRTASGPDILWKHTRPYRGLSAMQEEDSQYFYGRAPETRRVLTTLAQSPDRFPILIGNSGLGKSSIAMAGVFAALKRQGWAESDSAEGWPRALQSSRRWASLTMRPGRHPFLSLVKAFSRLWRLSDLDPDRETIENKWARKLNEGNASVRGLIEATLNRLETLNIPAPGAFILYLDQAEEVYAVHSSSTSSSFFRVITQGLEDGSFRAFASIRSDYYGSIQQDSSLFGLSERIDVRPLDRDAFHDIVTTPARQLGARFEDPRLPEELVKQALQSSLPLLSYLLDDMWTKMQMRGDGLLLPNVKTVNVGSVLAAAGDNFLSENRDKERLLKRLLPLRLVHVGDNGELSRRRASKTELSDEEWRVATQLADYPWRLLVIGQVDPAEPPYAEIAHEALLREWRQLNEWLTGGQGQREFLTWKSGLERARRRFDGLDSSSKPGGLLFGYDLEQAQHWLNIRPEDIPENDTAFINASSAAARESRDQLRLNLELTRATQSGFLADLSRTEMSQGGIEKALAFALEAVPLHIPEWPVVPRAENALFSAFHTLCASPARLVATLTGHAGTLRGATYSPDGTSVVTWSFDGTARRWSADDGKPLAIYQHDDYVLGSAISGDNKAVLTWSRDGTAAIWGLGPEGGKSTLRHGCSVRGAVFFRKSGRVLTWSHDGTAKIWEAEDGRLVQALDHSAMVVGACLSPNEDVIMTWSADGFVCLWNSDDGSLRTRLRHEQFVRGAVFSKDGETAMSWSADQTAHLWDVQKGDRRCKLVHDGEVLNAKLLQDSRRVVTSSEDGTAKVWSMDGEHLLTLRHSDCGHVSGLQVSEDGKRIQTTSPESAVTWDVETGDRLVSVQHLAPILGGRILTTGAKSLSWSADGDVKVWNGAAGVVGNDRGTIALRHQMPVRWSFFDDTGGWVWTICDDGAVRAFAAEGGPAHLVLRHSSEVLGMASSPANSKRSTFTTWSTDGTAKVWTFDNKPYTELKHDSTISGCQVAQGSARALTWTTGSGAAVWDLNSATLVSLVQTEAEVTDAQFIRNDSVVLAQSKGGTVGLWDAGTGECMHSVHVNQGICGISLSADEHLALAVGEEGDAYLIDTFELNHLMLRFGVPPKGARISPNGQEVVAWNADREIHLLSIDGERIRLTIEAPSIVQGVVFSDNSQFLAAWHEDGLVTVSRTADGARIGHIDHAGKVRGVKFSKEGRRVLTWATDCTVRVFNLDNGMADLCAVHRDSPIGAEFAKSDSNVYSWAEDGFVKCWEVGSGAELAAFFHDGANHITARLSMDEKRLLTTSSAGVIMWDSVRGERLCTWRGRHALLEGNERLLIWGGDSAQLWPISWNAVQLVRLSSTLVDRMRPLSKFDRCRAHLDVDGCGELGGMTERSLALYGDRRTRKAGPSSFGNLLDLVQPMEASASRFDCEIAVTQKGALVFRHTHPMSLSRIEIDTVSRYVDFIGIDGSIKGLGLPLSEGLVRLIEPRGRVLMALTDPKTLEVYEQKWVPLIVY